MEMTTTLGGISRARSMRLRVSSLVVAFALVAAAMLLVQARAEAAPSGAPAAAAIAGPAVDAAQISFAAIVCPILISIRNAFSGSVFFSFIQPILNQLLVAFGCQPSG